MALFTATHFHWSAWGTIYMQLADFLLFNHSCKVGEADGVFEMFMC